MTILSPAEQKRYARQVLLEGFGLAGQERLKKSRVLVVGAGGLGCPALLYLAASGVGTLAVVDGDKVEASNLQRQVLYRTPDVGRSKAEAAAAVLRDLNPHIEVLAHDEWLTPANARRIIRPYDLILDGTDAFSTRYLVNDACVLEGKPFVAGSIFKYEAQVAVYNLNGSGTYRCLFPEPPDAGSVPSCAQIGVWAVLPGVAGTLMASEAVKVLTGHGTPLAGRLLVMDLAGQTSTTLAFQRNPAVTITAVLEDYGLFCGERAPGAAPSDLEVTLPQLLARVATGESLVLLDVREIGEDQTFPLEPALALAAGGGLPPNLEIRRLPLSLISDWKRVLEKDLDLVVSCQKGGRSLQATRQLQASGFTRAKSLAGGQSGVAQAAGRS